MNALQTRLAELRRRMWVVVTVRGVCLTLATLLTGLVLAGLFDALVYKALGLETWSLLRAALLVSTLTATGLIAYRFLFRPLAGRTDDLSLALRVEEQYPILNDALASTVQFLENPAPAIVEGGGQAGVGCSPSLQKEAIQLALRLAQGCDFSKAVIARGFGLSAVALAAVLSTAIPLAVFRPAITKTALARIADPFGDHSWVGKTVLDLRFPSFVAIGQPLSIAGDVRGVVPAQAEIQFDQGSVPTRTVDIKETGASRGSFVAAGIKLPSYGGEVRFRVRAGNAVSPRQPGDWHVVSLRRPPQLAALNGKPSPQVTLWQPRYTELPEYVKLPEGTGNLDVIAGSHVTLQAAADQPIKHAWIEFKPLQPGAKDALGLAWMGPRHPVDAVTAVGLASSVWGRIAGEIASGGKEFTIRFVPGLTGVYVLTIQDKDGLSKSYEFDLNVRPDPVPTVSLLRPSTSQSVLANAELILQVSAEDYIFALRTVFLEYRRKDKNGQWVDSQPKRLWFYDHAKAEVDLPRVMSHFAASPFALPLPPLHLRPQRLFITQLWPLRGLAIEGETLVIQACAEDFNDVVAFPQPGRSHEIELKIVGKTALAAVLDEREVEIQQQLLKLRAMQDQAIKIVVGAEQQWRATGKLRSEDLVELAEAEQIQKDIQARVGTNKDEGLRGQLAQIEEIVKENKLPKAEVSQRSRDIREELERISRDSLPTIEPALNRARRELEGAEHPKPPDPKQAGDLGTARAEQEKVYQTLDDLLKITEEQATFQQLKGELRSILQEQQERKKEVEMLQGEVADYGEAILKKDPQLKGELRRTAELQRRLADRTEKLIERLEEHSQRLADKDQALAEMLERAAKIGKDEIVPKAMREIAKLLNDNFDRPKAPTGKLSPKLNAEDKGPNVDLARRDQASIGKVLESMLEALDQTRADEVERIVVHQKQEEKRLKELADKIGQMQEKIDAARKIADPKLRAAELQKLGEELRGLQKQAEQSARELGRAQAREAAEDLMQAAKKVERVLRLLDQGDKPDDALQEAQDRVESARDRLKEAREIAEEELAREQIAKIIDRLKGLKERQDAAQVESERLRKDFLVRANWTLPKVQSLFELKAAQDNVAGETATLKEKLKGALVFRTMLDRSHQDMLGATKKIQEWQQKATQHWKLQALGVKDLEEETKLYAGTIQLQKNAGNRLQRLIDALVPELEAKKPAPKQANAKDGDKGAAEQKGGIQAQDGIPSTAQLKALKAEQLEVNSRTKAFAEQHPNFDVLAPAERSELDAIHADQEGVLQLFRELMASARAEGGKQ